MELSSYRYNARPQYIRPKKKRSKRWAVFLLFTLAIYSVSAYLMPLPEPTIEISVPSVAAETSQLAWPATGNAAFGTLENGLLSSKSASTPQPIASVTKVITALLILDAKPLNKGQPGPSITITQADIDSYQSYISRYGSVANVKLGESITEYQALQAMLIPSANNIADTLARWAYGSVDAYVVKANAYLKEKGIAATTIADASGFSENSKSTPADLIKIGQLAMGNEVIKEIVAQREATIPEAGLIKNTNDLLADSAVIGIKTGNTVEAGGCLLFASTVKNEKGESKIVIGVILGESTKAASITSSRTLLNSINSSFKPRVVLAKGVVVGTVKSSWGSEATVISKDSVEVFGWSGSELIPKTSEERLSPRLRKNEQVSRVVIDTAASDLVLSEDLAQPSVWWRLTHPIR